MNINQQLTLILSRIISSLRITAIYFNRAISNRLLIAGVMCVCFVLFILLLTLDSLGSGNGGLRGLSQVTTIFLESSKAIPSLAELLFTGGLCTTGLDLQSLFDITYQATIIYGPGFVTFTTSNQAARHSRRAQASANRKATYSAKSPSDNPPASTPANTERLSQLEEKLAPLIGQRIASSFYSLSLSLEWLVGFSEAEGGR